MGPSLVGFCYLLNVEQWLSLHCAVVTICESFLTLPDLSVKTTPLCPGVFSLLCFVRLNQDEKGQQLGRKLRVDGYSHADSGPVRAALIEA